MFRHMAIFRLYPVVLRENWFLQRPVIYNDRGGTRSRFTKCGGFFGPLAWRLQALLCGRCSWAGPYVFGVHWVLWGFRSVDVLDVMFCSVDKELHCWCGFTYCWVCWGLSVCYWGQFCWVLYEDTIVVLAGKLRKLWDFLSELRSSLCERRLENDSSGARVIVCQNYAVYSVFLSDMTLLWSRLRVWNGLPLNTYISMYTRKNSCYN
jgi:hypothetical protein